MMNNNPFFSQKRWRRSLGALLLALGISTSYAQTVLVNPATDGGFELGSGSFFDNGWTTVNDTQFVANRWYTGTGLTNGAYSFPSASRCAYVSADNGSSWSYANNGTYYSVHFYKDITVPAGETSVSLSFKYQQNGNSGNAKLLVYACPIANTPVVGQPTSGSTNIGTAGWGPNSGTDVIRLLNSYSPEMPGTVTYSGTIPYSLLNNCSSSRTIRLVFTWNSSTAINNPPAAVDEISVISRSVTPSPTAGPFTINKNLPTSGSNFASFTEAVTWLNGVGNCGISNSITFNIASGQTFYEDVPAITAQGSASNQIVFQRSGSGVNPVITPSGFAGKGDATPRGSDYGICLQGADYVTFDGIDIIATNNQVEYGYLIKNASSTNGATNNTIKNMTILLDRTNTGSRGILQTESSTFGEGLAASGNANGTNDNNSYLNFTIGNVYVGVHVLGTSETIRYTGLRIGTTSNSIYNIIGRPNVPNDIGNGAVQSYGISASYANNITVHNNKVSNVTAATTVDGILLAPWQTNFGGLTGTDNKIYNNVITGIRQSSTTATSTAIGLRIYHHHSGGTVVIKVYNNVISNITSAYTGTASAVRAVKGMSIINGTAIAAPNAVTYEIVNNSIVIDGSGSPNLSNIVFEAASTAPAYIIRNNLFSNLTVNQTAPAVHYGMAVLAATVVTGGTNKLGFTGSVSNYNDIYIQNTTSGHVGAYQSNPGTLGTLSNLATLVDWKANFTSPTQDANSISTAPVLNSSTILIPNYGSPLTGSFPSLGTPYDIDIVGVTRSLSNSTIGAYERVGDAIAPVMNDTNLTSVYNTSNRTLTGLLTITDNTQVSITPGLAPRIYFKKSSDANVFGANTAGTNGWKWVEASNATSPFDFTIDYSLLNAGSVSLDDTIQYFYLAQDTLTFPNITVYPSAGFVGTNVATVTQAPTNPKSFIIFGTPATYTDAIVSQGSTYKVEQSSSNNAVIRVAVQTALTGAPGYVSSIIFNAAGSNDYTNISNAKVWYTGASSIFDTTTQFGTTYTVGAGTGALGNFTISGNQAIPSGTSYFWLSYSIKSTANATDSVDASVVSLTYDGNAQIPSVTTAFGTRVIKPTYCIPAITSVGYCVSNVTLNTLNNTTGVCGASFYSNYLPEGTKTTTLMKGTQYNLSVLVNVNAGAKIYAMFDYNDNGVFDAAEITQITASSVINVPVKYNFTVPCSATASELKMRIRSVLGSLTPTDPACTGTPNSEVEDYTLTLIDNPAHYVSSAVTQNTTSIAPSATDVQVMRIAVVGNGCGNAVLSELYGNTGLSTNAAADIAAVKLYSTGTTKTFNTGNLVTTLASPSGAFTLNGFSTTLATNPGDTNYYWLAYDLQSGATINNSVDMRVDSIMIGSAYHVPANNDPAGVSTILAPMSYLSTDVIQASTNSVAQSTNNAQILRINVSTSALGAPISLTKFNLNTAGGTNDSFNISTAQIYYTGNSSTFATTTQFGSGTGYTSTSAAWNPYSISGLQTLTNGDNYFWLVYNVKSGAAVGNTLDASLDSLLLNNSLVTPTTTSLAGSRLVRTAYCASAANNANFQEIYNVTFSTINNTSYCFTTAGNSQSIVGRYSDYSDLSANVSKGLSLPYSVKTGSCGSFGGPDSLLIYIDWNQDGDFVDAGEAAVRRSVALVNNTFSTGSIIIPCTALSGLTRMRVVYGGQLGGTMTPCLTGNPYSYGETEDYTLNIVDNPISVVSLNPSQSSSYVAQASNDNLIMRIPVIAQGCGTTNVDAFHFNTGGSTAAADIMTAKLYYTGTSAIFNTAAANLIATVPSPAGAFSFTGLSSAISPASGDTNNFWLAYDIQPTATLGNVVDAVLDSMHSALGNHPSAAGNPGNNALISAYMSHLTTVVTHPDLSATGRANLTKQVLKVMIVTSSTGAPADLTGFNLDNIVSGADGANLDSIQVFYTGHNNTFSTGNKFGSYTSLTAGNWGPYSISGHQFLMNDTNYFWVAFSVKATATIGDSLDASLLSSVINSTIYSPANGNPLGRILIRQDYCASAATNLNNRISQVILGTLNNTTACGTAYNNYTSLPAPTLKKQTNSPMTVALGYCTGFLPSYDGYVNVFIDYNQDGDFTDANEKVYTSSAPVFQNFSTTFDINPPCEAVLGETRLRVILSTSNTVSSCGTYASYGETEDYLVNITDNPQVFTSSRAIQPSGLVTAGVDEVMMNIKVKASNCGNGVVTEMHFNTEGSDNPNNDIASAKLYSTGASTVFAASNLLATVTNPNGAFSFSFNNTLLTNSADTNNYWLVYQTNSFAGLYDTLDVRIDSITVMGTTQIPANNDPGQYKVIDFPMTYVSSTVSQGSSDNVVTGTNNMMMLRIDVMGSSNGSPINATQFNLNTNGGGDDTLNISSAKIYYTGNDSVFAATNLFGTYPLTSPTTIKWPAYAITGSQALAHDTNYFWLVYDIKPSAVISDSVDAELASVVVDGITQIPTVTAPAGHIMIRSEYCTPGSYGSASRCINNVQFGTINNSTGCEANPYFTIFPENVATTNVYKNSTLPISVTAGSPSYMTVFIDFNRNGLFTDPGEQFDLSTITEVANASMSITIPTSARLGLTRMRVRTYGLTAVGHPSCATYNWSESEDYYITIMPEIPPTTYVWNQTSPANFTVSTNWTPTRLASSTLDRLVFGDGTPQVITVTNVNNQTNATIEIAPSTRVIFNSGSTPSLSVTDSLILGDSSIIQSSAVTVAIGTGITNVGTITAGTQAGINGVLRRWTGAGATDLAFPLCDSNGTNRSVRINYTTAPTMHGVLQANYVKTPIAGTAGLPLTDAIASVDINKLSVDGYWNLSTSSIAGGSYTGTFIADSFTAVLSPASLMVISRVDQFSNWTLNGTYSSSTGFPTNAVIERTGMSGFGQFTIASDSIQNPLPVTLLSFTAKADQANAMVQWKTSSEVNNKGFDLERSIDGRTFENVTFVKGNGTSMVAHQYAYNDVNAFANAGSNVVYYRLKQIDMNGKFTYSEIVRVSKASSSLSMVSANPNPFTDTYTLNIEASANQDVTVMTTDFQGRLVSTQNVSIAKGTNHIAFDNLSQLRSGVYFIKVISTEGSHVLKVVKH